MEKGFPSPIRKSAILDLKSALQGRIFDRQSAGAEQKALSHREIETNSALVPAPFRKEQKSLKTLHSSPIIILSTTNNYQVGYRSTRRHRGRPLRVPLGSGPAYRMVASDQGVASHSIPEPVLLPHRQNV